MILVKRNYFESMRYAFSMRKQAMSCRGSRANRFKKKVSANKAVFVRIYIHTYVCMCVWLRARVRYYSIQRSLSLFQRAADSLTLLKCVNVFVGGRGEGGRKKN